MFDVWTAFCSFVVIFVCVRLVMFCMTPPPPPSCCHDMNMKTLRCQICGVFAPYGYDGNGGINLESWPTAEDFD